MLEISDELLCEREREIGGGQNSIQFYFILSDGGLPPVQKFDSTYNPEEHVRAFIPAHY